MIDLRKLFDKYRIPWRDRGKNWSRGNINIRCPWCMDDPSEHLGVSETTGQYYCFRNPRHAGNNPAYLFKRLNLPPAAWAGQKFVTHSERSEKEPKDYSLFRHFDNAFESQEAIDYLESRLFSDPVDVAQRFNLKVSPTGQWAGRLIIPLTIGWTGRSMREWIEPRYLAETDEDGFFLASNNSTSAILVEGAIDAMKVATVTSQFDVLAKTRMALSAALLLHLRERRYTSIYNVPDGTVPYAQYNLENRTLQSYCIISSVSRLPMPEHVKDFGAMLEGDARRWIYGKTATA